ncbi:MAG: hypothetical protein OEM52_00805 [bacterium]|nr:hypothetical protein [bacterium]
MIIEQAFFGLPELCANKSSLSEAFIRSCFSHSILQELIARGVPYPITKIQHEYVYEELQKGNKFHADLCLTLNDEKYVNRMSIWGQKKQQHN